VLAVALAGFEAPQAIEATVTAPAATFSEDGAFLALGVDGSGGRAPHAAFREGYAVLLAAWFAPLGLNVIWGRALGIISALGAVGIFSLVLKRTGADPAGVRFSLLLCALSLPLLLAAGTIHPAALGLLLACVAMHLHLRWRDTQEGMWIFVAHGLLAAGAVIHPAGFVMGAGAIAALWFGSHDRVARDTPVVFALPWIAAVGAGALEFLAHRGAYTSLARAWLDGGAAVPAGGFFRALPDLVADGRWVDIGLTVAAVATAIAGVAESAKTRGSRRVIAVYALGGIVTFLVAAPGVRDPLGVWLLPALALAAVPALATPRVRLARLAWCALAPLLLAVIGAVHVIHTVVHDPRHGAWEDDVVRAVGEVPGIRKRTAYVAPEVQWALGFDRRVIRGRAADPPPEFLIHRLSAFPPGTVSLGGTEYEVLREGREYRVHRIRR